MTDTSPAALRALANLVEHLLDSVDQCIIVKDDVTDCNMVSDTLRALAAEKEAGAPAPAQGPLTEVGETSRGHTLYRAPNPVGGNTYWSDEIGGGVVVWDTCLVGEETLRLALAVETGAPAPDADGWIPWEGGECPVPDGTLVDVKLGDDEVDGPAAAEEWDWFHRVAGQGGDIIAYRLSKEG